MIQNTTRKRCERYIVQNLRFWIIVRTHDPYDTKYRSQTLRAIYCSESSILDNRKHARSVYEYDTKYSFMDVRVAPTSVKRYFVQNLRFRADAVFKKIIPPLQLKHSFIFILHQTFFRPCNLVAHGVFFKGKSCKKHSDTFSPSNTHHHPDGCSFSTI
jgi:hypothetical protein